MPFFEEGLKNSLFFYYRESQQNVYVEKSCGLYQYGYKFLHIFWFLCRIVHGRKKTEILQ